MSEKPLLTFEDFMDRENRKIASMSDAEKQDYFETLDAVLRLAEGSGTKIVPMSEVLGGEDAIPYLSMENLHTVMSVIEGKFSLKCRAAGNRKSKWKNKVFVTSTPKALTSYFDQVCEWIADDNVDIYFYDEEVYDVDMYSQLVSQMNAMVVIVSGDFLQDDCRSKSIDIKIARKYDIPIIPIFFNGSIQAFNEQIGNIELINTKEGDFLYKIRKHLNQCLVHQPLFERIKQEFSGKIFLSYRKNDVELAMSVLDILYQDERFWDVSVWYDDYLTPGEDYDDEIESYISSCDAFLLLVTPTLLQEDNYVLKCEYPFARRINKPMVAVEGQQTNKEELLQKYGELPSVIPLKKTESVIEALCKHLHKIRTLEDNIIEHKYYMALAYYWGIGVRRNVDFALSLMLGCVYEDYIPAIHFIATTPAFYESLSIDKKIEFFEFAANEIEKEFKNGDYVRISIYWSIAENLTAAYYFAREYEKEINLIEKIMPLAERISERTVTVIEEKARFAFRKAMVYDALGKGEAFSKALDDAAKYIFQLMDMDIAHKPYSLFLMIQSSQLKKYAMVRDKESYENIYYETLNVYDSIDVETQNRLSFEYAQLTQNYATYLFEFPDNESRSKAYDAAQRAIDLFLDIPECDMAKSSVSSLYGLLATQYFQDRNVDKAIAVAEEAVKFAKRGKQYNKSFAEELLAKSLFNCANICFQFDCYDKAEKYFIETIQLCLKDEELRCVDILRYACDYYARLLVIKERFDEAIAHYALFVNTILEKQIVADQVYEYCAQFGYRIGVIALNYLDNEEMGIMGLENAMAFIGNIRQLSGEMLELRQHILDMFGGVQE